MLGRVTRRTGLRKLLIVGFADQSVRWGVRADVDRLVAMPVVGQ